MKKRIFKIAMIFAFVFFVLSSAFNFLGIWILWQMKYQNISHRTIDDKTRKILFHLYGIKNMTTREKVELLVRSDDFRMNFDGKIDSALVCKIFPDQSAQYAVDSNFVINFHLRHGNPNIKIGYFAYYRDHFNPVSEMLLTPFEDSGKPDQISLYSYLAEAAHSEQFYESPFSFEFRSICGFLRTGCLILATACPPDKAYDVEYHQPGTIEYDAHHIIAPRLLNEYLEYRKLFFNNEIEAINEELQNKESADLLADRDSLLNGSLLLR